MRETLNINLFGQFGCGKGTQRDLLMKKYNLGSIETGEIIRDEIESGSELGLKFDERISQGMFISDEDIFIIVDSFFVKFPDEKGIVFDGIPRTLDQKEFFDKKVAELNRTPMNIEILIDEKTSVKRQINRREGRDDQNEEIAQKRVEKFKKMIKPVIDAYKIDGKMVTVDGEQTKEEVFSDITKLVEKHGNN
ncbi:nucleoside monophosphate kinase [Patescibacteria group bacterium]